MGRQPPVVEDRLDAEIVGMILLRPVRVFEPFVVPASGDAGDGGELVHVHAYPPDQCELLFRPECYSALMARSLAKNSVLGLEVGHLGFQPLDLICVRAFRLRPPGTASSACIPRNPSTPLALKIRSQSCIQNLGVSRPMTFRSVRPPRGTAAPRGDLEVRMVR